ncbi:FtsK/SpoIIIE domain-containing protein [Arthrobacter sp. GCM10027362]|uniref:FtsK/SpoIIIE domain-containing protein n=1 Tax=Arthrobacter sp. GCM10027362 TaxID=3273379 RepID=UPI0036400BFB
MTLHLSLAAAPGLAPAAAAWVAAHAELVVDDAHWNAAELARWLQENLAAARGPGTEGTADRIPPGPVPLSVGGLPLHTLDPGTAPLLNGAVVVCGKVPGRGRARPGRPILALAVTGGPDAGRIFALRRGRHVLGRRDCGLGIDDPLLSRHHAVLEVTGQAVRLRDDGSANGLSVGSARTGHTELDTGLTVLAGGSRLRLLAGSEPPGPFTPDEDLAHPVEIRARPPDTRGRMALLMAGLPLLAGLALAVATGMWFFLAFSAVSLAAAAIPYGAGRKQRRTWWEAVAAAAAADEQRRRCAAPDPARLLYGLLEPVEIPGREPGPPRHVWLRLGVADQPAHIGTPAGSAEPEQPIVAQAPVLVDLLAVRELEVRGSGRDLDGMLRCCLLQLGRRTMDSALRVICCGDPERLPASARFIPGVELAGGGQLPAKIPDSAGRSTVLLLTGSAAELPLPPGQEGVPAVIRFSGGIQAAPAVPVPAPPTPQAAPLHGKSAPEVVPPPVPAVVTLGRGRATLVQDRQRLDFVADLVAPDTLDRFARLAAAGGRRSAPEAGEIPLRFPLGKTLPGTGMADNWRQHGHRRDLTAVIGCTAAGQLSLDLAADGPHLLVAGTTGSGKSELLRSLVLGLAVNYSPLQVNFLLVDFKGGAGLGPLAELPHAAGMLTDLSVENVSRALRWLRAEVRRRESALARLAARDIADCAAGTLPRLVVVIDEFRMLADEVPDAVPELMRIAALGRSLGIHLVMATQRPQGAVTSDIRANVNAAIALRVQHGLDSSDVLGTPVAASIGADTPGRAYLRIAGGAPVLFQSACAERGEPPTAGSPAVQTLAGWLSDPAAVAPVARTVPEPDWIGELAAQARTAAAPLEGGGSGRVLAPPLPRELDPVPPAGSALSGSGPARSGIGLGLLDLPDEQRQADLRWLPERDGHLCLLGSEAGGARSLLQWLGTALLADTAERHCYLLDGDGSLGRLAGAGRIGAYVGPQETERGARVLRRLAAEVAGRLGAAPGPAGPASGARAPVPLVLLVSGWGRWLSAFRNGRLARAEEYLQEIARDGGTARVCLAMAGDRELVSARFFGLVPNRCFLPAGSSPETRLAWPRLPPMDPLPGRALVQGRISGGHDAVAQLAAMPRQVPEPVPPARRPFRVEALPELVPAAALPAAVPGREPGHGTDPVLGVEGDELQPSLLPLRPGEVYLVLGGAGSGKSNLMELLAARLGRDGLLCRPGPGCAPDDYWEQLPGPGPDAVLLVDDAHRLGPGAHRRLGELVAGGAAAVLTATPGVNLLQQVPLALQARSAAWGLVLAPRSPSDADFFGIRLEAEWAPPGRGYRIEHGRATAVQFALADSRRQA